MLSRLKGDVRLPSFRFDIANRLELALHTERAAPRGPAARRVAKRTFVFRSFHSFISVRCVPLSEIRRHEFGMHEDQNRRKALITPAIVVFGRDGA